MPADPHPRTHAAPEQLNATWDNADNFWLDICCGPIAVAMVVALTLCDEARRRPRIRDASNGVDPTRRQSSQGVKNIHQHMRVVLLRKICEHRQCRGPCQLLLRGGEIRNPNADRCKCACRLPSGVVVPAIADGQDAIERIWSVW